MEYIKPLLDSYQYKIQLLNRQIKNMEKSPILIVETFIALKTKLSCYKKFVKELKIVWNNIN